MIFNGECSSAFNGHKLSRQTLQRLRGLRAAGVAGGRGQSCPPGRHPAKQKAFGTKTDPAIKMSFKVVENGPVKRMAYHLS